MIPSAVAPRVRVSSPFLAIARGLLFAIVCGAPWAFGAVEPWAWASLMVLALLTLVLWAVGCVHRGALRIRWSPLYWPFLAFLFVVAVQLLAGLTSDHVATREALLKLITNFVIFFLAGQFLSAQPENGGALEWFALGATLLAFALCGFGLAQMYMNDQPLLIYGRVLAGGSPFGPYVNHNNYAGIMEMLLPISVAYVISRPRLPFLRIVLWSGVVVALMSVWISGSRAATLALVVEGLVLGGVILWHRPAGAFRRLLPAMVGVVVFSALVFSWLVHTGRVGGSSWTVFSSDRSVEASLGDRLWVSLATLRMARGHPWIGVGAGCFEYVYPSYKTLISDLRWTHAHDDIAEATAETGLPGTVLILVALALFFRIAFRHLQGRLRFGWGWIQLGAAVGTVGLLFHSLFDFNLRIPANAAWFVVCVAIATQPRRTPENIRTIGLDLKTRRVSDYIF